MVRTLTLIICLLALIGCRQEVLTPEEAASQTFVNAFKELQMHNIDAYLQSVDFGAEPDSFQIAFMHTVLEQHQDWQEKEKGVMSDLVVVDTELQGDTVCYVYYDITFADNTHEVSSQKMVRTDGNWRIRLRN